jgi:hypothetical protein
VSADVNTNVEPVNADKNVEPLVDPVQSYSIYPLSIPVKPISFNVTPLPLIVEPVHVVKLYKVSPEYELSLLISISTNKHSVNQ